MKYQQVLERTYYAKGFFNVKVAYDSHIRKTEGTIAIQLGPRGRVIPGKVSRTANLNGIARIFGGAALRDWFRAHFEQLDTVTVEVVAPEHIVLYPPVQTRRTQ